MTITPKIIKTLLDEKKTVFNGHPEVYHLVLDTFAQGLTEDDRIEIIVKKASGEEKKADMKLEKQDVPFFEAISKMLK